MRSSRFRRISRLVLGIAVGGFLCIGRTYAQTATARSHLPWPLVVNVDDRGMPFQPTFDMRGDRDLLYVWNTYADGNERLYTTRFQKGKRARTREISAGEGVYYGPELAVTGLDEGWVIWQEKDEGLWRIVGRHFQNGAWKPIERISGDASHALTPAITAGGSHVVVSWEDHGHQPQRIVSRFWNGERWSAVQAVSQKDKPSYRPVLAAVPDDEVWAFWDTYEWKSYRVYGRRIHPVQGPVEAISTPELSSVSPVAVYGAHTGLTVAWVSVRDVIGGAGVLDKWDTIRAAVRTGDRWELSDVDGDPEIADLRHSMLPTIEPEPGPIWGYSGRRRHPMLIENEGDVWLLWERKITHEGPASEPGQLNGRMLADGTWSEPVRLHIGFVDYEAPAERRARNGELAMMGMDTQHNFYTFALDLEEGTPLISAEPEGWEPVDLPLRDYANRWSITADGARYNLYWADLHVHTNLTPDAEGEIDEMMHFARDKAKIDVVVMQENDAASWLVSGSQGAFQGEILPQSNYELSVYYSRKYTEEGTFVALPGWEWSDRTDDGKPNHRTVIFAGDETPIVRHPENNGDFSELCDVVEAAGGIMNTQHPDYQLTERPCEGNIEVVAGWGDYLNPPDKIHADLSAGHEVGFVGTSDGHRRNPGTGGGLTAIYASELTSEAILEAIKEHRVYATNGNRMFIDARANGEMMGKNVEVDEGERLEFSLNVKAPEVIQRATLLKDGEAVHVIDGDGSKELNTTFVDHPQAGYHWYYWRIEQSGSWPNYPANMKVAEGHLGWSSPHRVYVY